jgi:hypothetical protein
MGKLIEAFGRWFASAASVWQTALLVALVVVFEAADPRADPNDFRFLYWATVYSAVTQPVLAYVGMIGVGKTDEVLARLEAAEKRELDLLELLAAREGQARG